jgi:hypothetical protein
MFFRILSAFLVSCALLVGCGGGGGSSGEPLKSAQGFWSGTVSGAPDGATAVSTVVTPQESAWIVLLNGSTPTALVQANMTTTTTMGGSQVSATGTGAYFELGTSTRYAVTITGVATTSNTFNGTATLATSPVSSFTWAMTGSTAYSTPARTADLVASWSGAAGDASVTVTWSVNASGAVSGTSSTGCSYAGTMVPTSAAVAVFTVAVTETCGAVVETLSGIATLNASKTILSVAYTAAAGTKGNLLQLAKPSST